MILYVLRYFPTLTETFVHQEIRGLAAAGVPVALAAFDPRDDPGATPIGVPFFPQPHRWGWLRAFVPMAFEWLRRPGWVPIRVLWLTTIVRRVRRVHVHFAGEAAEWTRLACARAGVPYSVTVHAVDMFKPRAGLREVLRDAAVVVTISEYNRKAILENYGIAAEIVRYGVRVEALGPPDPASPPVILAVGRWVPKKGLDTLAAVAPRLNRAATVRFVSDAPALPGVDVVGLRPHAEIPALLRGASLFVLPCRRAPDGDLDGLPVAIIEAMASGLPIITTAVSGIPELVDAEVGWIVPPDDEAALLDAIRDALDHPEEAARRGRAGRERVIARGFTHATSVASMRAVLSA